MTRNDFNLGNTVYQLSFLAAEIPSQMVSKRVGADRWVPFLMCAWAIVSGSQFFLTGRTTFLLTRALMGLLQGGFIPDIVLYLSYFFKSNELPIRLAIFYTARRACDIAAPLMAFGILRMRGVLGYEGWRWLFLLEGIIMFIVGVWAWFTMVPSPTQTKSWWNKKGWFTEREETIMTSRILRDDPSKGDMHNRQGITLKLLWKSLCDYNLWPIYITGLVWELPVGPVRTYLTLTYRDLRFDTFQTNLLSIPPHVAGIFTMLFMTWLTVRLNQRAIICAFVQVWYLPCLIALATLPASASPWAKFATITVLLSFPSPHPTQVGWASANSNSVRTRAISVAVYNMMTQLSRIIHANIYRDDDAPLYRRGNRVLVGLAAMNLLVYAAIKVYYVWENKRRIKKWEQTDDKLAYMDKARTAGSKNITFHFVS